MNKADFTYNDTNISIQCNSDDKMKCIINKFLSKSGKDKENLYFLYNGLIINEDLTFYKCANNLDKCRNCMSIVVIEGQSDDSNNLIKSNYVICPQCKENAFISIENYKITIFGCKNGHKTDNLQINEFGETQYIDQLKIKCDECQDLKSETNENKFFACHTCSQNLCQKCKDIHDKSHNIIDYEYKQFYCNHHFNLYKFYCSDCKKDLCISCKFEHEKHNIITYDNIIPDIDKIRNNQLKDIKDKIYGLKTIINGMINQLNNLNKNLDIYFEIYDNIISNFDKEKRNYSLIENVNNMKNYATNFIGRITEIIKDNNLKSQFINIINMQIKMEFKKRENNDSIDKKKEKDESNKNNEKDNEKDRDDIIPEYNSSGDKYDNFHLNQIKELQSFTTQNRIERLLVLNDRRILTIQKYNNEEGKKLFKLCVYFIRNEFICDINIDFKVITDIFKMDDGNVVLHTQEYYIKIIKVKKHSIEEIWKLDKEIAEIGRLLNNNKFLFYIKEDTGERIQSSWFIKDKTLIKYEWNHYIYLYEKGQFICEKNINGLYENEGVENVCQINENEFALLACQKGKLYGENDVLIFYDINTNKKIKTIKIGKIEFEHRMLFAGGDNLIVEREQKIILVDVKNRSIKNEFNYEIDCKRCICLNEKIFLYYPGGSLSLYEIENSKTIILKEEKKLDCVFTLKYPGNKLITYYNKKFTIYG